MGTTEQWMLLFLLAGVALAIVILYVQWYFIKSAVKAGVKEAILETQDQIKIQVQIPNSILKHEQQNNNVQ